MTPVEIDMLKNIIESFGEKEKVVNFSAKTSGRIGPQGAKEISETANWPNLTKFNINMSDIGDEGLQWLILCPWKNLETINLSTNKLTHLAAEALRKADWPCLTKIDISINHLGAEGVMHLQKCHWPNLKSISLEKNDIGSVGAMHLVKSDWPNLENINLNLNNIGDKGAQFLSRTNWPNLYFANFCYNNIEGEGMYYLAKSKWPKLETLMLNRNNIGYVQGKYSDLGCFYLSQMNVRLKELELVGNSISTQGVLMVLYSKMIGNVSTVIIRNNLYHDQAIAHEIKQIVQAKNIRIPFTLH